MPRLTIDGALSYNDSRVTDPTPAFARAYTTAAAIVDGPVSSGPIAMGRIPNVARFTARIGADYRALLPGELELRVGGWARYIGKSRLGIGPVLGEDQGNYLDTALTARVGRPNFGVTLGITNLADVIGNRFALGTPFATGTGSQITPLRPRTIRLGIDTAF